MKENQKLFQLSIIPLFFTIHICIHTYLKPERGRERPVDLPHHYLTAVYRVTDVCHCNLTRVSKLRTMKAGKEHCSRENCMNREKVNLERRSGVLYCVTFLHNNCIIYNRIRLLSHELTEHGG